MATNAIDLAAELQFALSLADAADALTLPRFAARNFTVDLKANQTEVTEVDRGTETLIMDLIRAQRPHHAWYGEEHGSGGDGEYTWVIDPIDGTSNFVRGVPVWATLIGLVHRDRGPVLGVVSAPAMATRWWGYEGSGAFCNGKRCMEQRRQEPEHCTPYSNSKKSPWLWRLLATHVGRTRCS
jgi:histidinol-phosphatase